MSFGGETDGEAERDERRRKTDAGRICRARALLGACLESSSLKMSRAYSVRSSQLVASSFLLGSVKSTHSILRQIGYTVQHLLDPPFLLVGGIGDDEFDERRREDGSDESSVFLREALLRQLCPAVSERE